MVAWDASVNDFGVVQDDRREGFACTFVCNSAGSGPSDPMSALEGAPGCVGAVRGGCAIFSYFH